MDSEFSAQVPAGSGLPVSLEEEFSVNENKGELNARIPFPLPETRNSFVPAMSLSWGGPNQTVFGVGWNVSIPFIGRSVADRFPNYNNTDVFVWSEVGDLVPEMKESNGHRVRETIVSGNYIVYRYKPVQVKEFVRIEQWFNKQTGRVHWKTYTGDGVISIYGASDSSRLTDPDDSTRVFRWMLEKRIDEKGNVCKYLYKEEDGAGVETGGNSEKSRLETGRFTNRYLKKVLYGNSRPADRQTGKLPDANRWCFRVVFDYGEHSGDPAVEDETGNWDVRPDPYSDYRAGFEIRTWRYCKGVLIFRQPGDDSEKPVLTDRLHFRYNTGDMAASAGLLLKSIRKQGYRRNREGVLETATTPPLEFDYTESGPDSEFREVEGAGHDHMFSDLFGEGVPGTLKLAGGHWHYGKNVGDGTFLTGQPVEAEPVTKDRLQKKDLDRDNRPELAIAEGEESGYYKLKEQQDTWERFRPFESTVRNGWTDGSSTWLDLTGDGRSDLAVNREGCLTYFPSSGTQGFKKSRSITFPGTGQGGAPLATEDKSLGFFLTNLSGSGQDIVEVKNGRIRYWPHLGYGKFGNPVVMDHSPCFDYTDQWDQNRIRFVDLNGSGRADLIYLGHDSIRYWINCSGNHFSKEEKLPFDSRSLAGQSIQVMDLFGEGTPCLVCRSGLPRHEHAPIRFLRLSGRTPAFLLSRMDNNMGKVSRVEYVSSATQYLEDRESGFPWRCRTGSHLQVVRKLEHLDLVSGSRASSRYRYRDAYVDEHDGRYRGFGYVEVYENEVFEEFQGLESDDYMAPVCRKLWFHDGTPDHKVNPADGYGLESRSESVGSSCPESVEGLTPKAVSEAYRSLAGRPVREEIFAVDRTGVAGEHPYRVQEFNWRVRTLVEPAEAYRGSSFAYRSEVVTRFYEQDPDDPRIEQDAVLKMDQSGYPVRSCRVHYPRQSVTDHPTEQQTLIATAFTQTFLHLDDANTFRHGIVRNSDQFELYGLDREIKGVFTWEELKNRVDAALKNPVDDHEEPDDSDSYGSRRSAMARTFYHGPDGEPVDRASDLEVPVLLHHEQKAVFTNSRVQEEYGQRVNGTDLEDLNYVFRDGYWWQPSPVQTYLGEDDFYLLEQITDPFGNTQTFEYDPWRIEVTVTRDALGNRVTRELDEWTLKPRKITDINGNVTELRYDALGVVVASSIWGSLLDEEGQEQSTGDGPVDSYHLDPDLQELVNEGDPHEFVDRVTADPAAVLQKMTRVYRYDLHAWRRSMEAGISPEDACPATDVTILRESHTGETEQEGESRVLTSLNYFDGFGRSLQSKQVAEPGKALVRSQNGSLTEEEVSRRWLTSGGTFYNNSGLPVRQYDPLYTASHRFESDDTFRRYGESSVYYFDALGRHVKTDLPAGFFTRKEITPWQVRIWDENDTVKESFYYETYVATGLLDGAELEAVQKAEAHEDTPEVVHLDPAGRAFIRESYLNQETVCYQRSIFDSSGRIVRIEDPRMFEMNRNGEGESRDSTFEFSYDMIGRTLKSRSRDEGVRMNLPDASGRKAHTWSDRGWHTRTRYDALSRVTEVEVDSFDDPGAHRLVEKRIYGEDFPDREEAGRRNLLGHLWKHYDEAGLLSYPGYTFRGEPTGKKRTLVKSHNETVNWNGDSELEEETFQSRFAYDALGRIREKRLADGTRHLYDYHLIGLPSACRVVSRNGEIDKQVVDQIEYDAKGNRVRTRFGNGVETSLQYEESTNRLLRLLSRRPGSGDAPDNGFETIQEVDYTYDPVGNLTRKDDRSREYLLKSLPQTMSSSNRYHEYTYDSLYRLTEASGWTHKAMQMNNGYRDGMPVEAFGGTGHISLGNGRELTRYRRSYTYDKTGNIKTLKQTGEISWTRSMWISQTSNRSLPKTDPYGDSRTDPGSYFDESGNLEYLDHLEGKLLWNYRNQLLCAVVIEREEEIDDAEYYQYGGDGLRVRKVEERLDHGQTVQKETIYLDECEIHRVRRAGNLKSERWISKVECAGEKVANIYHWNLDEESDEPDSARSHAIHYLLSDERGSVNIELDEEANLISCEEYFPYGESAWVAGDKVREVSRRKLRYCGKERDDVSGLYDYGFRYYMPWMCRWVSPDPAGPIDGLNLYEFVRSNPINRTDELGLDSHDEDEERKREARHELERMAVDFEDLSEEQRNEYRAGWEDSSRAGYPLHIPAGEEWHTVSPGEALEDVQENDKPVIRTDPALQEPTESDETDFADVVEAFDHAEQLADADSDPGQENGESGQDESGTDRSSQVMPDGFVPQESDDTDTPEVEENDKDGASIELDSETLQEAGTKVSAVRLPGVSLNLVHELEKDALPTILDEWENRVDEYGDAIADHREAEQQRQVANDQLDDAERAHEEAKQRREEARRNVEQAELERDAARHQARQQNPVGQNPISQLLDEAHRGSASSFDSLARAYEEGKNQSYERGDWVRKDAAYDEARAEERGARRNVSSTGENLDDARSRSRAANMNADQAYRELLRSQWNAGHATDRLVNTFQRMQLNYGDSAAARVVNAVSPTLRRVATVAGPLGTGLTIYNLSQAESTSEHLQAGLDLVADLAGYVPHPATIGFSLSYSATQIVDNATGGQISSGIGNAAYWADETMTSILPSDPDKPEYQQTIGWRLAEIF